jgi:hypothetical protein
LKQRNLKKLFIVTTATTSSETTLRH